MNIIVINREDRPDRLEQIKQELGEHGLNAIRFNAVVTTRGWAGCRDSHIEVLTKNKNRKQTLILEDDVQFVYGFRDYLNLVLFDLPKDWDCVYLGGSPQEPQERYSAHLFRCKNTLTTHAILWNNRSNGAYDYIIEHTPDIKKIDVYMRDVIQPLFNCFITYPMLATQRSSKSNVAIRSDVSTIVKNYNLYCK